MRVRHSVKQVLRRVPGFAGLFERRDRDRLAITLLTSQLEAGQAQLVDRNTTICRLTSQLEAGQAQLVDRDATICRLTPQVESDQVQLVDRNATIFRLREQADALNADIDAARTERDQIRGEHEQSVRETAALRDQNAMQFNDIAALRDEVERLEIAREVASHLTWEEVPELEGKGLFVVGHARSGTGILMRALNTSPEVHVLSETNMYANGMRIGFPNWYNDMTRAQGNVYAKGSYCPFVNGGAANGPEIFRWLGERHRYVGEKVAFQSKLLGHDADEFFHFQARFFFNSHYLCIIRNPADVLLSNNVKYRPEDLSLYAESYLRTLELCLALNDTMPNVLTLFHENVDYSTFETIGKWLEVDFSAAAATYDKAYQVQGRHDGDLSAVKEMDVLIDAHKRVKAAFSPDTLREIPHSRWQQLARCVRAARETILVSATPQR